MYFCTRNFLEGEDFPSVIKMSKKCNPPPPYSDPSLCVLTSFIYSDEKFGVKNHGSKFTVVSIPTKLYKMNISFSKMRYF